MPRRYTRLCIFILLSRDFSLFCLDSVIYLSFTVFSPYTRRPTSFGKQLKGLTIPHLYFYIYNHMDPLLIHVILLVYGSRIADLD